MAGCVKFILQSLIGLILLLVAAIVFLGGNESKKPEQVAKQKYDANTNFYAYITAGKLNVRKHPDKTAPVIGTLKFGDVVHAISKENGWIKVQTKEGVGYISEKYAENMGSIYRVSKDAVSPMTRNSYPKTYKRIGAKHFREANLLLPKAARLSSENSRCDKVDLAMLSDSRTTKDNLWFFADCQNGTRIWISKKDIERGDSGRSSIDMAPDETSVKMWCIKQIKRVVNYPETLEIHDFAGYATRVTPSGDRVTNLDFTAKNAFGVPIRKTAVCTVTSDGEGSFSLRDYRP